MTRTRQRAAALAAGLVGCVLVALAPAAVAEEISDLQVVAVVSADTTMSVTETIAYDFTPNARHGIYRDIPLFDELVTGDERHYGVEVASVRMDGAPVPFETGTEGSYLRVRIGDPEEFVTGSHEYVIEYRVTGALQSMSSTDAAAIGGQGGDAELYWDFVGNGWGVPIANARARLDGPVAPMAVGCFFGPYGADTSCPAVTTGATVSFGPVELGAASSLTGAAAWPASAFTMPIVQDIRPGPGASAGRGALVGGVAGLTVIVVMIGLAFALRRRDRGVDLPLAPPVYGPPCGLAPAEVIAALEGVGSTSTSLMATILDLAARGWLQVSILDGDRVLLARQSEGTGDLREWEARLLEAAFGDRSTVTLGEYDPDLATTWTFIGMKLVDAAEQDGYRNAAGGRADRRWVWIGSAGAIATLASAVWLVFGGVSMIPAMVAVLGLCLVVGSVAAAVITPRTQTATSARLLSEVAGLTRVLGTDPAASRQLLAQASGLPPAAIMATMLPYAVALGLEDAWVSAFPDLDPDDLAGSGLLVTSVSLLGAMLLSGADSASGALTPPPESSSSSSSSWSSGGSGLSGGGHSGGGGGGGGGGSW